MWLWCCWDKFRHCDETCELWCKGEKVCAFKLIAMELIKLGEKEG